MQASRARTPASCTGLWALTDLYQPLSHAAPASFSQNQAEHLPSSSHVQSCPFPKADTQPATRLVFARNRPMRRARRWMQRRCSGLREEAVRTSERRASLSGKSGYPRSGSWQVLGGCWIPTSCRPFLRLQSPPVSTTSRSCWNTMGMLYFLRTQSVIPVSQSAICINVHSLCALCYLFLHNVCICSLACFGIASTFFFKVRTGDGGCR